MFNISSCFGNKIGIENREIIACVGVEYLYCDISTRQTIKTEEVNNYRIKSL